MCLNLIGSQFKNLAEVEEIMNCKYLHLDYVDIEKMKDDRTAINKALSEAKHYMRLEEEMMLGI